MIRSLREAWDHVSIYLPLMLMGMLAMGSWWLVRSTPSAPLNMPQAQARHEADYYMNRFAIRAFDAKGRRKHEIVGARAVHYPDTDTLEISEVQVQSFSDNGEVTTATAERGLSNADGSEVQLFGNARVVRERPGPGTPDSPVSEIRSAFLHVFTQTETVRTHHPVTLLRGRDRFQADAMEYDNLSQVLTLRGHVHAEVLARTTH